MIKATIACCCLNTVSGGKYYLNLRGTDQREYSHSVLGMPAEGWLWNVNSAQTPYIPKVIPGAELHTYSPEMVESLPRDWSLPNVLSIILIRFI